MPHIAHHDAVHAAVEKSLGQAAAAAAPWFLSNMPEYYLHTHTVEEQVEHLHAVISGQVLTQGQTVVLRSPCRTRVTYITPGAASQSAHDDLLRILEMNQDNSIETARIYTSKDGKMRLDTLLLAGQTRCATDGDPFKKAMAAMHDGGWVKSPDKEALTAFLAGASQDYVNKFDPARTARHFRLAQELAGCSDAKVELHPLPGKNESRILLGFPTPPAEGLLLEVIKIIFRRGLCLSRAYGDVFNAPETGRLAVISLYVNREGSAIDQNEPAWPDIEEDLRLVKWFAPHGLDAFADTEDWPLRRVMLLQAACEFAHQFLVQENLWAYTSERIVSSVLQRKDAANMLIDYFFARHSPDAADKNRAWELESSFWRMLEAEDEEVVRKTLACILRFFKYTLRTNYFLENIFGLAFRLSSDFLEKTENRPTEGESPYGFFFFHGPFFLGFHVRYRETARGGVRMVPTRSQEQFEVESNRLFDEVTGLALAQQYKNKDIPEGGSKAVLLLGPKAEPELAMQSMVNSLLDVILPDPDCPDPVIPDRYTLPRVVDYMGKQELIYLGPDENVQPEHIVWAVDRAAKRGYPYPAAFMSSKPGAGINHKVYGVTSLGVIVFAVETLKHLGIDPQTTPFSVKFTGGPRGDVAGNAMRILIRGYGDNARIVAMTDGHGAAWDPNGLDHQELLRLIDEDKDICSFDPAALKSDEAFAVCVDGRESARIRNTLHNTARADIFIPAGGRPNTINERNWAHFLDDKGRPTAKAIIEGANLFISQPARDKLQEKGVLIVHGSSANKTGVICSSYEILGGLVMSEDEFLEHKETFVSQVLDILKVRAGCEAKLMLHEYRLHGGRKPLTTITMELSKEINSLADRFYEVLLTDEPDVGNDPELAGLLWEYCPPVLVDNYADRLLRRAPARHIYALIASFAASRIVYNEGIGWLRNMASIRDLEEVIRAYLQGEQRIAGLVESLQTAGEAGREAAAILQISGRKHVASQALGLE